MRSLAVVLVALAVVPCAGAWKTNGHRWPRSTISYANVSPGYGWSLQQAVAAWNASGTHVRFVEVPRARAQVLVSQKLRPGTAGEAGEAQVRSSNAGWVNAGIVRIARRAQPLRRTHRCTRTSSDTCSGSRTRTAAARR